MADFTQAGVELLVKNFSTFDKNMTTADKLVEEFGDETEKTAKKATKSAKSVLQFGEKTKKAGKFMLGAGTAIIGAGLALGKMAAPLEGIGVAFEKMAGRAGLSLDALSAAAGGTVADFELMRNANIALTGAGEKLGVEFGEKLPGLMEIARASAIATGQSTEFMFESLVTGVKRSSPMLIDNTGLQLKLGEANKALADEMGITVKQLSSEDKQIALLNATLLAGQAMVEDFGTGQRNAAEEVQALGASLQNARDQIGLEFVPLIQKASSMVNQLASGFTNLSPPMKSMVAQIGMVIAGVLLLVGGLITVIPKIYAAVTALQAMGVASFAALGPIGLVVAALAALGAAVAIAKKVEQAHKEEAAAIAASSTSYKDYVKRMDAARLSSRKLTADLYKLVKAEEETGQELAAMDFEQARGEMRKMTAKASVLVFSLEDLKERLLDATASADDNTLAFMSSSDAMYDFFISTNRSEEASRELADALSKEAQQLVLVKTLTEHAALMGSRYSDTQKAAKTATDELTLAEEKGALAAKSMASYGKLRNANLEDYAEEAEEAEKATEELLKVQQEAIKVAKEMRDAYASVMAGGLLELRNAEDDATQSTKDYQTSLEDLQEELTDLEQKAGETSTTVKTELEVMFPDKSTYQQRMTDAGDAWDEFAARARDVMANGIASPWVQHLINIGGAKPSDVGLKEWAADLERLFYEGGLPEAINTLGETWDSRLHGVRESQTSTTTAVHKGVQDRIAAVNEEIAVLEAARTAQLAQEKAARDQQKLEMAIHLLEQSGDLKAWSEQRFTGPEIDLSSQFDEADEVIVGLQTGLLDLDSVLDGLVVNQMVGIDTLLKTTEGGITANEIAIAGMHTTVEQLGRDIELAMDPRSKADDDPFKPVKTSIETATSAVLTGGEKMGKALVKSLDTDPTKAVEAFSGILITENQIWQEKTTEWTELLLEITDPVIPDLQLAFETMSTYVLEQLRLMLEATDAWREAIEVIINVTLPALKAMFAVVAAAIIKNLIDMIAKTNEFRRALEKLINKTLPEFKRVGVNAFEAVAEAVQGLIDKIVGDNGLLDAIASATKAVDTMATDMVKDINAVSRAVDELIGWLESAWYWKKKVEDGGPKQMFYLASSVNAIADAAARLAQNLKYAEVSALGMLSAAGAAMSQVNMPMMAGATTTNNIDLHFGPTAINNNMDQEFFEERVIQAVRDNIK